MKVNVLTPIRKGGPYGWGRSLAACVNASGRHYASHLHAPVTVLSAPLRQDADLVHTSLPLSVRLWKKPVLLTVHGDYTVENSLWKRLYPAAVRTADAITTPSRFLKERLGLDDAQVIPNAIFPENYAAPGRRDSDTVHLVTVTKFYFKDKAQGVLDLLRIIHHVSKRFDGLLDLTVVGGGKHLRPVIDQAARFDVPVHFTGFLDQPSRELARADIFVYYSTHDNFPVALLEAMASGLPVLTNDVGAVREIITQGWEGYVSGPDEEYAANLHRLLEDGEFRRAMGRRARKRVEEDFNWHTIAAKYIALYDSLRN